MERGAVCTTGMGASMSFSACLYMPSVGLIDTIFAPPGTLVDIQREIDQLQSGLGLRAVRYRDNPPHWGNIEAAIAEVPDDDILCDGVADHNQWVFWMHERLAAWRKSPVPDGAILTPEGSREWVYVLSLLSVPPARWTPKFYRHRMDHAFEVLRGRENEGVTFDAAPLTVAQTAAVIALFSAWLDPADLRLEVPRGEDRLWDQAEYEWCDRCGAVTPRSAERCRKRSCPVREDKR